ncbi:MAG: hypothetical protein AB7Y74_04945 [Syntrophorhabdus sp.]|jgi:hypothetical protein
MNPVNRSSFIKFLEHTLSNREVSLAIAPDNATLKELIEVALAHGLTQCKDAFEIAHKIESQDFDLFITLDTNLPKPLYDLVVQYPMGHVQLNDPDTLAPIVVNPRWEKNAVLIIADRAAISTAESDGFNLLSKVGLCWQPLS